MKTTALKKVVIIGLGLMGGSLAAAIRKKFPAIEIVGVARKQKTLDSASRKKWIHEGFLTIETATFEGADLAIICTPIDSTSKILESIDRFAPKEIFVTDVGSVKTPITDFAKKKKWKKIHFIGAHPMVGSHEQGIEHARADLYQDGLTIVTGAKNHTGFKEVTDFWKALSGKVMIMTAAQHDQKAAEISHLPHLLSVCLMQTPAKASLAIAATGFRDTTRLAEGPDSIWAPIFQQNRKALLKAIRSFKSNLDQFESILKKNQSKKLSAVLKQAASQRNQLSHSTKS